MSDTSTRLFEEHRRTLEGVAYRILGLMSEARDMVQDTWLKWREADPADIENPRAWLITVCSRLALNRLRAARRRERYVGAWLPEPCPSPASAEPGVRVELDDTLSMALLVALERLNPSERAAFLLHDVFDLDFGQIALVLDRTPAGCRQLATRARKRLDTDLPRFPANADEHLRLVEAFARAARDGELAPLTALLAQDAELHADGGGKVPTLDRVLVGAAAVAGFMYTLFTQYHLQIVVQRVNGAPALLIHEEGRLVTVLCVTVDGGRLSRLHAIRNPDKLRSF